MQTVSDHLTDERIAAASSEPDVDAKASPPPPPSQSRTPIAERLAGVLGSYTNVQSWEASVYVERLECLLRREIAQDEADALICVVSSIKYDHESLTMVLGGASTLIPMPDTKRGVLGAYWEFERRDVSEGESWREDYELRVAEVRQAAEEAA